ncbi:MAG: prepilin-type N-terminal cleavage/methylation domain-containing protein [Rhodobacter sp.]|nr:prepilin-type N-terminal cleavage/methylation domain-containing protein [Rhodobacter sp.]
MKRSGGFSLLELVVVLAIFALVALIGVQVIQATVRNSRQLTRISEESGELAVGLALLRQDLNAALPRSYTPPNGGTRPALTVTSPDRFSLTVGGLAQLDRNASGLGRVTWRFDRPTGQLYRQVWTSLNPGGLAPEVPVLGDVSEFALSHFTTQGGWRAGYSADPRNIGQLPLGLRVRLTHARAGEVLTVVSLR